MVEYYVIVTVENRLAVQMDLDLENLSYKSEVPEIVVNDGESIEQSLASFDADSLLTYNSIDHQYNFDGNSHESGHSSRSNSIVTFDSYDLHEGQPKKQGYKVVKWMDSLYELFQEPKSKEEEDLDGNISYEESQVRLIILSSFLALSLALIASILSSITYINSRTASTTILNYQPLEHKIKSRSPHLALLLADNGVLNVYKFNASNQLEFQWNFSTPKLTNGGQHFAFAEQDDIHVLYGDMKKVNTVIKGNKRYSIFKNLFILQNLISSFCVAFTPLLTKSTKTFLK